MAVAMKQKDLRSDSWNHRGVSAVRMSTSPRLTPTLGNQFFNSDSRFERSKGVKKPGFSVQDDRQN